MKFLLFDPFFFVVFVLGLLFCLRYTEGTKESKKGFFWFQFSPEMLRLHAQSQMFLSLMPNVKKLERCPKRWDILACVFETKTCFFFHRERERGTFVHECRCETIFSAGKKKRKVQIQKKPVFRCRYRHYTIWRFYPKP